jgi:hypothetical protein
MASDEHSTPSSNPTSKNPWSAISESKLPPIDPGARDPDDYRAHGGLRVEKYIKRSPDKTKLHDVEALTRTLRHEKTRFLVQRPSDGSLALLGPSVVALLIEGLELLEKQESNR